MSERRRHAFYRWVGLLSLSAIGAMTAAENPANFEATAEFLLTAAGHSWATESSSSQVTTVSWFARRPLSPHWYWSFGTRAERFEFPGYAGHSRPKRLQDFAAQFSLFYLVDGESVAEINLHPGWYFGSHPKSSSWDVPIDATSGVPITASLDGVIGLSSARFYHHPVPVVGLIWRVNSRFRFEAVYPEPALIFLASPGLSFRCGGELSGGGFEVEQAGRLTPVEYSSYRLGFAVNWKIQTRIAFVMTAGDEWERNFDFFRQGGQLRSQHAAYGKIGLNFSRE